MNKDIEVTIKKFFESVNNYAFNNARLYTDHKDATEIDKEIKVIIAQEKLIQNMLQERVKGFDAYKLNKMQWEIMGMEFPGYHVFMKTKSYDNSVLVAYRDVIRGLCEYLYYGLREESFLRPLKQWYFLTSNKSMKGLIYPFLPLKHFIVKESKQRQ